MYIAIAGTIGSGKTSLTEILSAHYGAKAYYEDIDNPYISDFYEDMNRWSFNFQMFFLGSRINQTIQMLNESTGNVVQDRTIHEDAHIFAGNLHQMGLMSTRDYGTYMKIFTLATDLVPSPDILIYLKASVPTLVRQILKRGREYEKNIDLEYLERLNNRYNEWISSYKGKLLTINIDEIDFVGKPEIVDTIIAHLDELNKVEGKEVRTIGF
ncbi:MAG: deoxynucleoside kinase [Tidjanibacter sp.]|nr:deoxynucleoside kinase [Tidjanibacter sp.]